MKNPFIKLFYRQLYIDDRVVVTLDNSIQFNEGETSRGAFLNFSSRSSSLSEFEDEFEALSGSGDFSLFAFLPGTFDAAPDTVGCLFFGVFTTGDESSFVFLFDLLIMNEDATLLSLDKHIAISLS